MGQGKDWSKQEIQFLKDNYQTMSYSDIGKQIGRSELGVANKCTHLGLIKIRKDRWTQEELDFITQNISTMSYKKMAEYLNRSISAIEKKVHRDLKIKKSPYTCNYHYFENIDTEDKAYWLGFIYADGYISISHDGHTYVVGINLQAGDVDHLKKFNKSIEGNYKIIEWQRSYNSESDDSPIIFENGIRIYSKQMVNDLIAHGVNEHKTYNLQFIQLEDTLMPHFIRGYFDGNGSITYQKYTNTITPYCRIYCYQLSFLDPLRIYLYQKEHIYSYIAWSGTCYRLTIAGAKYARQFLDYIYGNATIYLDRKYHRYQIIKNHEAA